ncbi:iron complex outermembrane recepter protein [Massilia sp. CF038]|nr:iron complex outermembrane recepter protein [Massilia sp. CF038]
MTMKNSHFATRSLIALAVASAFPLHAAMAQEAAPAPEATAKGQLETVIVTAQRRAENIKDVPMAIATLKGEKLDVLTASGQDIRFLSGRTPSVQVESDYGRTFPRFYIRGMGNTDFDLNASQPVGLVFDDVVQENPMLKGFPVFDVDQIEVLRGPQGTLFGRNSPAGVIKFDSAKPVIGKTEGYFAAGIGNYSVRNLEGAYNIPISDTVAARVSLQSQHRGDRVHNDRPNAATTDFEGYDDNAGRLQLLVKPSANFSALFNVHARDYDGSATLFRANIIKKGTNELVDNFDYGSYPTDGQNEQKLKTKGGSMRLKWNLDDLTLHSITGYEKADIYSRADVDGGYGASYAPPFGPGFIPFTVETADILRDHRQITQEVRLESNYKGPLNWIGGLFYFDEQMAIDSIAFDSLTPGNPQSPNYGTQTQDSKAWAAFGSMNYTVSDRFKVRAGLRYTNDKKDFVAQRYETTPVVATSGPLVRNLSSTNVSWDLSGTYVLTKETNLFARAASGYRAPSVQGRLFGVTSKPSTAESEKVVSVEAGVKQDLFDRRARLSASVYRYQVKDLQLTATSGSINENQLINAKKAIGQGLELDFQANLADGLSASIGASYNDTEIKDPDLAVQICGNGCTATDPLKPGTTNQALLNGNPLPRAPKTQANFSLKYSTAVGNGEVYAFTDWAYRSSYNFFLDEAVEYKAKSLLEGGVRVGYKWDNYELSVYGRNITNKVQLLGSINFNNLTGIVNEPRSYGAQFRATF